MAALTIALWQVTDDPKIALYFAILSDIIGFSPTIIKCYKLPFTEDPKFYFNDVIAGGLSLVAVENLKLNKVAFPLYIFLVNLLCFSLILIARRRTKLNINK
jgi:hypothetical protein